MSTQPCNFIAFYRALSAEQKAFLSLANKEVGLGPTLEFVAEKAGLPSELRPTERAALRQLAIVRNLRVWAN